MSARALPIMALLSVAACNPAGPRIASPAGPASYAAAPQSHPCGLLRGAAPTEVKASISAGRSSATYPVLGFDCVDASRTVNATIEKFARGRMSDECEVTMGCSVVMLSSTLASIVCWENAQCGGAHPFHPSTTLNFVVEGNSARKLALGDLFEAGVDAPALLGRLAEASLRAKGVAVLDPGNVRVNDFLILSDGLVAHLPEYAATSYLDGTQDVLIPYAVLGPYLRPALRTTFATKEDSHARRDAL